MAYLASSLREKHSEDKLHIYVPETNAGNNTYDGVDLGAERVTKEIETCIQDLEKKGSQIKKLSVVGYSLGGLVARYTIGLLHHNGWFDRLEPVNFTTFASPHLGVRTPMLGFRGQFWNSFGSRTLSASGRQLFTIDEFRDTGRPLLSVLADPDSIFMIALSKFRNRVLYANIVNDRSAPYYTTCISTVDEFVSLDAVDIKYLPGYESVVLDPENSVTLKPPSVQPPFLTRLATSTSNLKDSVPMFALLVIFIPVGTVVFLVNSGIQSVRSGQRIRLHEEGKAGIGLGSYRIPLMVENAQSTMDRAFSRVTTLREQQYLPIADTDDSSEDQNGHARKPSLAASGPELKLKRTTSRQADFPTLAMTEEQFAMVDALDKVGFRKYRVHMHTNHSHAAIIVRAERSWFSDGKVVVRHWLEEEFEI